MSIIGITRFIIMPFMLWQAKRRSKKDNTFTIAELEQLHELLTKNRKQ
jgi:hypothetical protein